MARSTAAGSPAITYAGTWNGAAARELMSVLGSGDAQVLSGSADQISFPGTTIINGAGIDACTLAAPIPGPQPMGDDGKTIEIFDGAGFGHTITCPANAIIGSKHLLTFSGTKGGNITLQAWNGVWMPQGTPNGVTIS